MSEQVERLRDILFFSDARILELYLALYSLAWGVWLVLPYETFAPNPTYRVMATVAPECLWGIAAIVTALVKVGGLMFNHGYGYIQKSSSLTLVFIWTCVAISCAASSLVSTATSGFWMIAFANAFCVWRRGK